MNNLLNIEQQFISEQGETFAFLTEIEALNKKFNNAKKNKFKTSIAIAVKCYEADAWFKLDSTKESLEALNITWSTSDMQLKLFGFQRSFFGKLKKVGQYVSNNDTALEQFLTQVKIFTEENGYAPSLSIANFKKFMEGGRLSEEEQIANDDQSDESLESSEEGQSEEGTEETSESQTLCTFTFKDEVNGNPNISMRIDTNILQDGCGLIISSGEKERIKEIMLNIINLYL